MTIKHTIKATYKNIPEIYKLFFWGLILTLMMVLNANGATLINTNISPQKIFKCQSTEISVNYSGAVNYVTLYVNITGIMVNGSMQEEHNNYNMTNATGGQFIYYYGNDPAMLWGNKTISFKADTNPGENTTNEHIFVYSDECSGTDIIDYRNTTFRGSFGNYTGAIFRGEKNILTFAEQPYLLNIGSIIYLFVMFIICVVIYIKSQTVIQPLIIVFITAISLVGADLFPPQYRIYALLITAAATAAVFWRLGKSA